MRLEPGVYHVEYLEKDTKITITDVADEMIRNTTVIVADEDVNGYEQCLQDFGYRRSFLNI